MLSDIISGISNIISTAIKEYQPNPSHFKGFWKINVYADDDKKCREQPQTISLVKIKGNHNAVKGTIHRLMPDAETDKRWKLTGKFSGENFLATFCTLNDTRIGSNGVFFLRYNKARNCYIGHYLKYDYDGHTIIEKNALIQKTSMNGKK